MANCVVEWQTEGQVVPQVRQEIEPRVALGGSESVVEQLLSVEEIEIEVEIVYASFRPRVEGFANTLPKTDP
jgi:hypothetical protein